MYCQTLPISNYNLNPTNTSSSFHCLNPNAQPIQFAKFQSVSKFRFGFCNSIRRVSVSPNNLRKHVGLVGIRCEGLQGKEDTKDDDDKVYIKRCLELARKAVGCTSPNPMVGCVIVKDDKIVGEGFHPKAGQPHAEVFALRDAGDLAENATAYVSLEPCNHHGRTPPCSEALIKAKVKKVVVGMVDPNPIVASRGVAKLRDAGIDVTVGVEEEILSDDLGEESTEAGGYYSRLLQEHDAVVLSSKSLQKHPLPESKEPNSNQPLHIVLVKRPDLPHLTLQEETASKVIIFTDQETDMGSEQGIETVVLDKMNLTTILEHCQHQGLCSVLLDLRGSFGDFEDILKGVEENLVQKFVVEVLPVWGESKEEASFEAIKISQRA
ncbi:APOBEC/CMP deaminase, zinc-binding, partial [Cynara cardunculus var. scolymus]